MDLGRILVSIPRSGLGGLAEAVIYQLCCHRMVVCLAAIAYHFDIAFNQPICSGAQRSASICKIIVAVTPDMVLTC